MDFELDGQKLYFYMERVKRALNGETVVPITVEVSPTNRCNNNCIFCGLDYRREKLRDLPINFKLVLQTLIEMGVKGFTFAGEGEPTLNPNTVEFIQFAKTHGAATGLMTNGIDLVNKKIEALLPCLSWIRFSINANTHETYAKVHGVKEYMFDAALDGLKRAILCKKENNIDCAIGVQSLYLEKNFDETEGLAIRAKELGADYFTLKPYSQHPQSKNKRKNIENQIKRIYELGSRFVHLSTPEFQAMIRTQSFVNARLGKRYKRCLASPYFMVIDSRGDCYPCASFIGKKMKCFGSAYHTKKTIFGSKRRRILKELAEMDCTKCRTPCRLDIANEFIDKRVLGLKHKEFI